MTFRCTQGVCTFLGGVRKPYQNCTHNTKKERNSVPFLVETVISNSQEYEYHSYRIYVSPRYINRDSFDHIYINFQLPQIKTILKLESTVTLASQQYQ